MARRRSRIPLDVHLNSRPVGRLHRQASGAVDFQYDESWLAWEHAIPVSLSLPLREDRYIGDPVLAVLENLLPDPVEIRRRLAERLHAEGADPYSLLAAIGRDCVGALQFLPDGVEPGPAGVVRGEPVDASAIGRMLGELGDAPLGLEPEDEFRISLAGAQEKTALLHWQGKWHRPEGATPTTHILKPQIGRLPNGIDLSQSVENEYLCMKLAEAFGLPTAAVEIADFGGTRALVIERFDRQWTEEGRLLRLPQEDCCQALSVPPSRKYESDGGPGMAQVLDLLQGSDEPDRDRRLFLGAQILLWLLGATDGHAKSFSIFLRPGGRFVLTPLYDVLSAQPALATGQLRSNQMKLAMRVGRNRHAIVDRVAARHFLQTGAASGIGPRAVEDLLAEIVATGDAAIDRALAALPAAFPARVADPILEGLRGRLATLASGRAGGG